LSWDVPRLEKKKNLPLAGGKKRMERQGNTIEYSCLAKGKPPSPGEVNGGFPHKGKNGRMDVNKGSTGKNVKGDQPKTVAHGWKEGE